MSRNPSALGSYGSWFDAANARPALRLLLDQSGIHSQVDYLRGRTLLSEEARSILDRFRLGFLIEETSLEDRTPLIEIFAATPESFRSIRTEHLDVGQRARNCLRHATLSTIGQVADMGENGLADIPNCGRKTISEIAAALRVLAADWLSQNPSDESQATEDPASPLPPSPIPRRQLGLADGLRESLDGLPEKLRRIVEGRLGFSGRVLTLEQLAAGEVTRERIRQLETKAFDAIRARANWPADLASTLLRIFENRTEPAWIVLLPTVDTFFDKFDFGDTVLSRVIELFGEGNAHCFRLSGALVASRIRGETFDDLRHAYQEQVRSLVPNRPTQLELEILAESICMNAGARELHSELFSGLNELLQFAKRPGTLEPVLVGFGRGAEHVVMRILESAEGPLHYLEVHRRAVEVAQEEIEVRRIHSALNQDDIFLFGRGIYGLRRHMNVSEEKIAELKGMAEEIMLEGDPGRQWHAQELLEEFPDDYSFTGGAVTPYMLAIALHDSRLVRSLNRMVWVVETSEYRDSKDRIDVAQACARILRDAGRPMRRMEIVDQLRTWRGVSRNFQIHSGEELIALAPGLWGLRERDLPMTKSEIAETLNALNRQLSDTCAALHLTELKGALREAGLSIVDGIDEYWIASLAGTDKRFRIFPGSFIGLASWEISRRFTIQAAARELAQGAKESHPIGEWVEKVEQLTKRSIGCTEVTYALRDAGFTYDEQSELWQNDPEAQLTGWLR
jgi:Bacterial RNA polymerase, alpha chain C terminal domain/Sigma-70, region 4